MVKSSPRTLVLTRTDVECLLDAASCIDAVERAFLERARGGVVRGGVLGVSAEGGGFHAKAALLGGAGAPRYFAAKLNSNFPANPRERGLPTIQGVLALFHASTGVPLAVMDSIGITLLRTAAATAVAARHLALPGAELATIVGCGAQAMAQLVALHSARRLRRVFAFDTDRHTAQACADSVSRRLGVPVEVPDDLRSATRASRLIVTCTTARTPFLGVEDVEPGTFIAAVGADAEDKQEIAPALMARAAVVVDDLDQCATIGDLRHAIAAGTMRREDVRSELAGVVADPSRGRRDSGEIVVFDSTGVALEDVAAARVVYERALEERRGLEVTFSA